MLGRIEVIESQVSARLLKSEAVLWSGRPAQGIRLMARDIFLIPLSIFWCGFAVFWEVMAISKPAPAFFPLFGLPFVLIGLFVVVGRFLLDAWVRSKIAYFVTDKRILINRSGPWPSFKAMQLDRLPEVTISEAGGMSGTIRFGQQGSLFSGYRGFSIWLPSLDPAPQFVRIEGVASVYSLIQEHLQGGDK